MGAGPVQTAISAQTLVSRKRFDIAVSVGPVGSLSPQLKSGTWTVVESVVPWQKAPLSSGRGLENRMEWQAIDSGNNLPADMPRISVASGEMFVASAELNQEIASATDCTAVDMNLFGLLSVLSAAKIPSLHIRVVSDAADESAAESFKTFIENYDGTGGRIAAQILSNLPEDKTNPTAYPELESLFEPTANETPVDP